MRKMVLIVGDHRWTGPEDYFSDAYFTEKGQLRVKFTVSDLSLQYVCLAFEPLFHLTCGQSLYTVFRLSGIQHDKHITRFEELLSRNTHWEKRYYSLSDRYTKQSESAPT